MCLQAWWTWQYDELRLPILVCSFCFVYLPFRGLIPSTKQIYFISCLLFNFFIVDFIIPNLVQTLVLPILHRIWTIVGLTVSGVGLESWMHDEIQLQNMRYACFFSLPFILMGISEWNGRSLNCENGVVCVWGGDISVVLLGEAIESCTLDGESPVAESITSSHSNLSSMGHVNSCVNKQGPPCKAKYP